MRYADDFLIGVIGTIKSGKLTISARYNYNYNDRPRSYSGGTRRTVGDITDGSSDLDYSGDSKGMVISSPAAWKPVMKLILCV